MLPATQKLVCLIILLLVSTTAHAQSLWQRRNERFALFFVDTRAHLVGDLLTVVISENTDVLKRDQRAMEKSSDGSFNFDFASASSGGAGSSGIIVGFSTTGDSRTVKAEPSTSKTP